MGQNLLSGHMKININKGMAGIIADPSWSLQVIFPASMTARLAERPAKMPNATQSCQDIVNAPRIGAGEHSAAKTEVVEDLMPIPIPRSNRQTRSCSQDWVKAEPSTERKQKIAEMKIVPRRAKTLFNGGEHQHPL